MRDTPAMPTSERLRPAPHLLRLLAWSIDFLLVLVVFVQIPRPETLALFLSLFIAYHTLLAWLAQRTAGKALLGLKVERVAGRKPGFLWALGRVSLGYFIVDVLGAGVLVALFNHQHRCPHDYLFGSVVTFPRSRLRGLRALQTRLQGYVDQLKSALSERFKTISALAALMEILGKLAEKLRMITSGFGRGLGYGSSGSAQGTSVAGALSLKATAITLAATTAITSAVLVTVPPVRHAAEDLFKPYYFSGAGVNGQNLIVNGDAEARPGSIDGSVVPAPGWKIREGEFTVIRYGNAEYPSFKSPGPVNRGLNFFGGGSVGVSSASQLIDVSANKIRIDSGEMGFTLSGYLGGWAGQEDNTVLTTTFMNAKGNPLGTASIGPVTSADRNGETALLQRSISGKLPVGTMSIEVLLRMSRTEGTSNDGYADNLSLVLSER